MPSRLVTAPKRLYAAARLLYSFVPVFHRPHRDAAIARQLLEFFSSLREALLYIATTT